MGTSIENGAAAWVHSREDEQKNLTVSSQRLTVDSSVLESYMGQAAFDASVQSYGGITSRRVFLHPDDETNGVHAGWVTPANPSGGDSGGQSGSSQSGQSGQTGGGTTDEPGTGDEPGSTDEPGGGSGGSGDSGFDTGS